MCTYELKSRDLIRQDPVVDETFVVFHTRPRRIGTITTQRVGVGVSGNLGHNQ